MFWVKKDSQKQMPKIDFSKKGENTYFKTHNRLCSSCRMSVLLNNLTDSAKDLQEHLFNVNDYICKPNNVSYSVHELNKLHL